MKWQDRGVCVHVKNFGENQQILSFLTQEHGLWQGVYKMRKNQRIQPGNIYQLMWWARLPEHMGTWQIEISEDVLARVFLDSRKLLVVASACAMSRSFLPERMKNSGIYSCLEHIVKSLSADAWLEAYMHFEKALLRDQGYIMNWQQCAVTQATDNLIYVSPQTGNIVSEEGARGYEARLIGIADPRNHDAAEILRIYTLLFDRLHSKNEAAPPLPRARATFVEALLAQSIISGLAIGEG